MTGGNVRTAVWYIMLAAGILGCGGAEHHAKTLTLATTTSTRDSGLLDELVPLFEQQTGIKVKVVAVGSGQALEMGRRGDADLLLTHSPDAEQEFVLAGHGSERLLVMSNDFLLVGPSADPAQVASSNDVLEAIRHISAAAAPFVSRGDDSGTHVKERALWEQAGVSPVGDWYLQAGSGMAQTLRMASEKRGYTLADRGTFLAQRDSLALQIVHEGDPRLRNQYAVITINPEKHPHVNVHAARKFRDFLLSNEAQQTIRLFGVAQYGEPLFFSEKEL